MSHNVWIGFCTLLHSTAPGLPWDAMLKLVNEGNSEKERVHLKLIDDIDMYQIMEKGIRGGISVISQKYAKANNPYAPGSDNQTIQLSNVL